MKYMLKKMDKGKVRRILAVNPETRSLYRIPECISFYAIIVYNILSGRRMNDRVL